MATGEHKAMFRVVDPALLEKIALASNALKTDASLSLLRRHKVDHALKDAASRHSVAMEMPNGQKISASRAGKLAMKSLRSAQEYFAKFYHGNLTEDLIVDLGSLIMPRLARGYRRGLGFAAAGGVYPRDPVDEMAPFLEENNGLSHEVEKACHAHFHLARIHPFADGNGRLARLVQNGILMNEGLPPIVINNKDRSEYLDLLSSGQNAYKLREAQLVDDPKYTGSPITTSKQSTFYSFLGERLLFSLEAFSKCRK